MNFNIITAFPQFYDSFLNTSLIKKAIEGGIISFNIVDLKNFGIGKYKQIDDRPFGGDAGMILRVDVLDNALETIKNKGRMIVLSPNGNVFNQNKARELSKLNNVTLICGRYEGFDKRIYALANETISIGNFVTMGGEAPSLILIEAVARLIEGVLGNKNSLVNESFTFSNELEYPQYTKPRDYKNMKVPEILLSGDHVKIRKWREKNSKKSSYLTPSC